MKLFVKLIMAVVLGMLFVAAAPTFAELNLTPEEAVRPIEDWTPEQIRAKGWVLYGPTIAIDKHFGDRWPKNDPNNSNFGACVSFSFMPDLVALEANEGTNNWSGMPAARNTAVGNAATTWAAAADLHLSLIADGGGAWNAGMVGDCRFGAGTFSGSELAHAYYPPPNGVGAAGDVHFNLAYTWVTSGADATPPYADFDMETVALHEFGHALGLSHTGTLPADAMFPYYVGQKQALTAADIAKMVAIYGVTGHAANCNPVGSCTVGPNCIGIMTAADCATAGGVWGGANTTCVSAPPTSEIPTLSEWGMIIFSLLILSLATVVVVRRRMALTPAGAGMGTSSTISGPTIVPALFWKTLVIVETIAMSILLLIIATTGSIPLRDIAGTLISSAIAAYIVHLWILAGREK